MSDEIVWGVDLGGTKIEAVVATLEPFNVIDRQRIDTEQKKGYEHILDRIKTLIESVEKKTNLRSDVIGIGTPGSINPRNGLLRNSNTVCLNGKPLKEDLEKKLEKKIVIGNDANCLTLAEVKVGIVPKNYPNIKTAFGIIMGTGVGGGLFVNGKIINGHMGIAGEWGHNFLDESGGECYCKKIGCVERLISGAGLERFYEEKSGTHKTLREIYSIYQNKTNPKQQADPLAIETIERLLYFFGKALAGVVNIFDPDIIIIGGGVGNISELTTIGRKHCEGFVFNPFFDTPIVKPLLGDSSGVFGAALLSKN